VAFDRHVVAPQLLERFRRGDQAAFLEVYEVHGPDLRGLAGRFFASPYEREEATQEIWLQAHRMSAMYDPERGALLPWLRALAVNRCKELLRARGRHPDPRAELDEETLAAGPETGADPHEATRQHRLQEAIQRFAAALSREEAAVFRHSLLEDRAHDEVARMIGISARRCRYLRRKLLVRAAADRGLAAQLDEFSGGDTP
jgi:RNA polymerase sigma-70 factor (ECF subfamily)